MKKRLLDWILCPQCGERPRLDVFQETRVEIATPVASPACSFRCARHGVDRPGEILSPPDCDLCYREEILEGALSCACGLVYPIIDGIPRMIRNAREEYPDFFARHGLAGGQKSPGVPGAAPAGPKAFGPRGPPTRGGDPPGFKAAAGRRRRESLFTPDTTPRSRRG